MSVSQVVMMSDSNLRCTVNFDDGTTTVQGSKVARLWAPDDGTDWSCTCSSVTWKAVKDPITEESKTVFHASFPCLSKRWNARCFKCGAVQPFPPSSVKQIGAFKVGQFVSVKVTEENHTKGWPRDQCVFRILNLILTESKDAGDSWVWVDIGDAKNPAQPFGRWPSGLEYAFVVRLCDISELPRAELSTDAVPIKKELTGAGEVGFGGGAMQSDA
jgi:hypothetical protein